MIDDRITVDQSFAIVEHEGWNPTERVGRSHFFPVAEARQWSLFKGDDIDVERDGNAACNINGERFTPTSFIVSLTLLDGLQTCIISQRRGNFLLQARQLRKSRIMQRVFDGRHP
jgi:hypothetical protein